MVAQGTPGHRLDRTVRSCCSGAIAAVAAVASTPEGHHFRTPHTWLGVLTVVGGDHHPGSRPAAVQDPPKGGSHPRGYHRLFGRLLNLMAPIAILLGLRVAEII